MQQAISSWYAISRPLSDRGWQEFNAWARTTLAAHRQEIVLADFRGLRSFYAKRVGEYRAGSEHYAKKAEEWKQDTSEMVERLARLAAESEKDVAYADGLIARIEAEGLPPEVLAFDPLPKPAAGTPESAPEGGRT